MSSASPRGNRPTVAFERPRFSAAGKGDVQGRLVNPTPTTVCSPSLGSRLDAHSATTARACDCDSD